MFMEFSQLALGKAYVLPVFPQFLPAFCEDLLSIVLVVTPLTGIMKCVHT